MRRLLASDHAPIVSRPTTLNVQDPVSEVLRLEARLPEPQNFEVSSQNDLGSGYVGESNSGAAATQLLSDSSSRRASNYLGEVPNYLVARRRGTTSIATTG